ncbi:conjugal transfer protein TraG [Acetobacter estunensis]|uniref:conjugal transfer protein TraG n=1 Tax=Acetobacter estunensis TaxID=104097 RepID=UPI001C2CC712|nr:conjugal transfer protein TraG [Acetobacter estunensis]MBV1838836.1 conjugal transfer protein TraG [Acetobacter estunensis]
MDQPGTRIQWGQALVVLSMIVLSWWTATQWTAWELAFQPELGRPWFTVLHRWPVYAPPLFFWWWYEFDAYAPAVFARGAWIAGSGGGLAFAAAVALSVHRAREAKRAATYGSARWAEDAEIRAAGLLDEDGVVLGKYRRSYLRHDGPEHVLTFAPTRTGKGVGMVIPTLLTWPGSAIIHDIKGENWQITAGFRNRFGRVLLFDPTNPASSAYNPLLEVRRGASEVRDVQNIADILVDPEGSLERRNHWEKTSHALLVGAILHVLYAEDDKTLAGVAKFLSDPKRSIEATLSAMMRTSHLGKAGPHPVVASAARELLNKSDNERSGVLSTAMSFLGLYRDPVVATVTSRCEWRIGDLLEGEQPVSLYFVIPPSDISRTKPLIRLILNQIDKAYGQNNSILDNCHVRVSFATNDERTAKRVSDGLGVATEIRSQKNYAGHRLSPWLGHLMVSRQESARPLMTVGEVMQIPAREEVVMVAGCPPIRARKARYFRDRRFVERVLPPPDPAQLPRPVRPDDWSDRPSPVTPLPEQAGSPAAPDKPDDADSDESLGTGRKWSREHDPAETDRRRARTAPDLFGEELPPDMEAWDRADLTRIARQAGLDRGNDLGL